ncbi:hypothetical protein M0208_14960 [Sphingomonas sp. SUN019]|uniref:hypothetical protein n=1 Tax=Sphingomonas sp. SUN019 TaxID=2937788 RepID=UPI002164905F|nr:hypothetical protein [Sphingomonas sp. SUN019]UVO51744.1 hypothetical protein M0208_14960 [Sphingomonas sp. SUN019]
MPDVVADAVRLGYQVIEENLRHGRMAADRFRAHDYNLGDATDDVQILGRRVLDLARDLGGTWFDLVAAVLDDPRLRDAVRSRTPPSDPSRPGQQPGGGGVTVRVIGHPSAIGEALIEPLTGLTGPPQVTPLRQLNNPAETAAITGVRLGADPDTGAPALLAPVPPDQPPGVYSGTVHDAGSGRLLGSISLTVPGPGPSA